MGPINLIELLAGKWVQYHGHDMDLTGKIGDTPFEIHGKGSFDLRIGDEIKPHPQD